MGAAGPGQDSAGLVNLWQWKASRELNAQAGRVRDVVPDQGAGPGVPTDLYMFKRGDPVAGPLTEHDPTFLPAWREGNPHADPALLARSVLESNAIGFGSLTLQPAEEQGVTGRARWSNGRWRVLMVRDLTPGGEGDVDLRGDGRVPAAFAVWDGAASDRGGTKLISGWHELKLGDR